jgi:GNAT superfamily N-acetyltransferase
MEQDVLIEAIDENNFDEFLFLIDKLAEYEKLTPPDEAAKIRLRNDGLNESSKYEAYLGRVDGKAVGYLIFFMTYSSFLALPTFYIEDIFILEQYRHQGIGQQMFGFCVREAKERGCGRIEFCVLHWNTPAIKFYEKNSAERLDWYFYRLDSKQIDEYLSNH